MYHTHLMRGETLFNNLIETPELPVPSKKGRCADLVAERNELLMARYYYLRSFTDKSYDAVLQQLKQEFFLSVITIPQIVEKHVDDFLSLKRLAPNPTYFSKKWPHIKW